tara:strand:+ start:1921 stop:2064 length:144 start_codon:yes stop_codon:yes gene_type:complete
MSAPIEFADISVLISAKGLETAILATIAGLPVQPPIFVAPCRKANFL